MDNNIFPMLKDELRLPYFVTAVGGERNQNHVVRPEGYPNYHWMYCTKGKGVLIANGNKFTVGENMGFFLFPHTPHEYYAHEAPWETRWVVFDGYEAGNLINILGFLDAFPYSINVLHIIDRLVKDIYVSAQSKKLTRGFECSYLLYKLLIELKNHITSYGNNSKSGVNEYIQHVITFIEENYFCDFTLDELAMQINASPQYLCRIFNQTLNMRPFEYLTKYRIQKAKEFLINDYSFTVNEISEKVGYHDTSYFCAKFKKHEGMTPVQFRNMYNSLERKIL